MYRFSIYVASVLFALTLCIFAALRAHAGAAQGAVSLQYVKLQTTTPGTPQTGHSNISGTIIAGQHVGGGSGLTGLNASNISSGTLSTARLPGNVARTDISNTFDETQMIRPGFQLVLGPESVALPSLAFDGDQRTGMFSPGAGEIAFSSEATEVFRILASGDATLLRGLTAQGFAGNGSALTGVNADLLDGLNSTAFLQSVPIPLSLSGANASHIIRGENTTSASDSSGVIGISANLNIKSFGVYGESKGRDGRGVYGKASNANALATSFGVFGEALGSGNTGVYGKAFDGFGVLGETDSQFGVGVTGRAGPNAGSAPGLQGICLTVSGKGVYGNAIASSGTNYGVYGQTASGSGYGVFAAGNMGATGTKSFRIDHPFDPENKYLLHYSAEAPEPQNFYNGSVTTDAHGKAWVELPDYFGEVNKDPQYQLTVIDDTEGPGFVQVKVARKIHNNRFMIMTSTPHIEVSWEVKAKRNDLWVRRHGAPVEVAKDDHERGKYQHPELYNLPKEMGMNCRIEPSRDGQPMRN